MFLRRTTEPDNSLWILDFEQQSVGTNEDKNGTATINSESVNNK